MAISNADRYSQTLELVLRSEPRRAMSKPCALPVSYRPKTAHTLLSSQPARDCVVQKSRFTLAKWKRKPSRQHPKSAKLSTCRRVKHPCLTILMTSGLTIENTQSCPPRTLCAVGGASTHDRLARMTTATLKSDIAKPLPRRSDAMRPS
jgi:hypothetical protein